jgi:hypothetical protein
MASLNKITTSTALVGNQNIVYSSGSGSWDSINTISFNSDMTDFFELVLAALGYDINFEDFKNMSKEERKQLIRDIKLKTII